MSCDRDNGNKIFDVLCRKELSREICKTEGVKDARSIMPAFNSFSLYWSCRIVFFPNEIAARCEYIRTGDGKNKGINQKAAHQDTRPPKVKTKNN